MKQIALLTAVLACSACVGGTPAQQAEQWDATACAFQAAANNFAEAKKNDVNAVALANVVSATAGTMCIPLAAPAVSAEYSAEHGLPATK